MVGRVVEWNVESGYGFLIRGDERWFLHVRHLTTRDLIPARGDLVRFVPGTDPRGRPCASEATLLRSKWRSAAHHGATHLALLILPAAALWHLPVGFGILAGIMASLSLLTLSLYARDKEAALSGKRRVPESLLQAMELCGGWPGALLAQRWLRHKCTKPAYQRTFWTTIVCHQWLAFDVLLLFSGIWETAVLAVHG